MYSDMPNMYNNVPNNMPNMPNNMTNIPNMYNQPKQSTDCTINWALYLIDIVLSICLSVIAKIINDTNSVFAGSSPDIYENDFWFCIHAVLWINTFREHSTDGNNHI